MHLDRDALDQGHRVRQGNLSLPLQLRYVGDVKHTFRGAEAAAGAVTGPQLEQRCSTEIVKRTPCQTFPARNIHNCIVD